MKSKREDCITAHKVLDNDDEILDKTMHTILFPKICNLGAVGIICYRWAMVTATGQEAGYDGKRSEIYEKRLQDDTIKEA
jgi:hypothetical protein